MEMDDDLQIINHWQEVTKEYSNKYESKHGYSISEREIFDALYLFMSDKDDIDWIGDVWEQKLGVKEIENILRDFNFKKLNTTIETSLDLIPRSFRMITKVRIKSSGMIWVIHKYDKDPFPSNPHAHNLESNIKLHLGNGKCYCKREHIYSINKKELVEVRDKILQKINMDLPALEV